MLFNKLLILHLSMLDIYMFNRNNIAFWINQDHNKLSPRHNFPFGFCIKCYTNCIPLFMLEIRIYMFFAFFHLSEVINWDAILRLLKGIK